MPFALKCPDVLKCNDEPGQWVPNWYARAKLKDVEKLSSVTAQLNKSDEEVLQLKIVDAERLQQINSLEVSLSVSRVLQEETEKELLASKNKLTRRTRWALGSSGVAAVALALLAGLFASY